MENKELIEEMVERINFLMQENQNLQSMLWTFFEDSNYTIEYRYDSFKDLLAIHQYPLPKPLSIEDGKNEK